MMFDEAKNTTVGNDKKKMLKFNLNRTIMSMSELISLNLLN